MKNTKIRSGYLAALAVVLILCMRFVGPNDTVNAQVGQMFPNVYQSTSTVVGWTAGTVNNGGEPVAIVAGTNAVTDSQTSCAAPAYSACNIVWANSSGTVSVTATSAGLATATASGSTILAYVETAASGAITSIVYPQQASTASWPIAGTLNSYCGTTSTCANTFTGGSVRMVFGHAPLAANGVLVVSGISPAFTSATSYACTASLAAGTSIVTVTQGTSTVTFTYPGAATHEVYYQCIGS